MLGVLISFLATLSAILLGRRLFRETLAGLDPAAHFGLSGLIGLALVGSFTFLCGLFGQFMIAVVGVFLAGAVAFASDVNFLKDSRWKFKKPEGSDLIFPVVIGLAMLLCLFAVLAPSDSNDWDTLAYHLAVPKLWLQAGKISVIDFIHQSNFPFTVDSLYILGLKWGGAAGAKAFNWFFTGLGAITLFGLGRQRYGQRAGWWAALAFCSAPVVLLETGTGYIDVAHGLYAGLGIVLACWWLENQDRRLAVLSGIMLGFATGTKYTGLQTIAVVGIVMLIGAVIWKRDIKWVFLVGLLAILIGAPWYVKNALWKENPVFPFFYSKLGGKDWDQRRADAYTNEQNGFGVGREAPPAGKIEPGRLGHSVLGLAYQPGRYINPRQTMGLGDPLGAVGMALMATLTLALFGGLKSIFQKSTMASVLLSLLIWFVLTQQSRYIITLAVPLALLAAELSLRRILGLVVTALIGLQAAYSLGLLHLQRSADQMQVVLGKVTEEEYLTRRLGFYVPSKAINQLGPESKTALYDEVFGYMLDVPYYWANPGHSTLITYDSMQDGRSYADGMRRLGFTHVYMNLGRLVKSDEDVQTILGVMGGQPFAAKKREEWMNNWEVKFNALIPEAVAAGELEIVQVFGNTQRPQAILLKFK
ncbi:MAG: hypothetical protein BGO01_05850 [Armatimonadetes bacterium 55-13]|nr:hypothetical protein [Armatimonadota bacterium]OJU61591.1 MAG: hypothetical protein BGO01_05850 [Armatimonadetes bacterium 55-13]